MSHIVDDGWSVRADSARDLAVSYLALCVAALSAAATFLF